MLVGFTHNDDINVIKKIAKKACDEGTGARALRKILEERMLDLMFGLPYENETNNITINENNYDIG